jgi:precorrin-2 dehydrogenase / sirohydrochlorin ferrochelatase
MALYPIFLKLEGRKVLIVGGGRIAEEKAYAVLRSAKDVTVVAPEITPRMQEWQNEGLIRHITGRYQPGMASEFFLVIACTDSESINRSVYEEAQKSGVLCNAVDDPSYCDFYAPAVVSRGDFQIAISTGGRSPALAQRIRKSLEADFGPEYESWTGWLGRMREGIIHAFPRSQRRTELLHLLAASRPAASQKEFKEAQQ